MYGVAYYTTSARNGRCGSCLLIRNYLYFLATFLQQILVVHPFECTCLIFVNPDIEQWDVLALFSNCINMCGGAWRYGSCLLIRNYLYFLATFLQHILVVHPFECTCLIFVNPNIEQSNVLALFQIALICVV